MRAGIGLDERRRNAVETLNEAAAREREREVTLSLVAPNKATLAFQDERQVYRREFMRAELQRWSSWVPCFARRSREEESEGRKETERVESIQVDSSRVGASSRLSREGNFVHFHPVGIRPPALSSPALENFARDRDEDNDVEG